MLAGAAGQGPKRSVQRNANSARGQGHTNKQGLSPHSLLQQGRPAHRGVVTPHNWGSCHDARSVCTTALRGAKSRGNARLHAVLPLTKLGWRGSTPPPRRCGPVSSLPGELLTARLGIDGARPTTGQSEHQTQGKRTPTCCAPTNHPRCGPAPPCRESHKARPCGCADSPPGTGSQLPRGPHRHPSGQASVRRPRRSPNTSKPYRYAGLRRPASSSPPPRAKRAFHRSRSSSPSATIATPAPATKRSAPPPSDIEVIHIEALIARGGARGARAQAGAPAIPYAIDQSTPPGTYRHRPAEATTGSAKPLSEENKPILLLLGGRRSGLAYLSACFFFYFAVWAV